MGTPALGGYYLSRTNDYVKYLINQYEVESGLTAHGRNLTMDRLYGDLALSRWLLVEKNITCICTWQQSKEMTMIYKYKPKYNLSKYLASGLYLPWT